MKTQLFQTVRVVEVPLDELRERLDQMGNIISTEYKFGLYCEIDSATRGEIANIERLMKKGFFPPKEKEAIIRALDDYKLNPSERKALERGIQRLRNLYSK
jgi:hypothetical protein